MALLLRHLDCASCGTQHNLGIDANGWDADTTYEYVCPQTRGRALMRLPRTATAEGAPHWPQGAVQLRPAAAGVPVAQG
jgi:hypothetical protein